MLTLTLFSDWERELDYATNPGKSHALYETKIKRESKKNFTKLTLEGEREVIVKNGIGFLLTLLDSEDTNADIQRLVLSILANVTITCMHTENWD